MFFTESHQGSPLHAQRGGAWVAGVGVLTLLLVLGGAGWSEARGTSRNAQCRSMLLVLRMAVEQWSTDHEGLRPLDAKALRAATLSGAWPRLNWYPQAQAVDLAPRPLPQRGGSWGPLGRSALAPAQLEDHGAIAYRASRAEGWYELTVTMEQQGQAQPSSVHSER